MYEAIEMCSRYVVELSSMSDCKYQAVAALLLEDSVDFLSVEI